MNMDTDGLVSVASAFSVDETVRRLTAAVAANHLTVFATVDHGKNAADVGLALRPTVLVIFGNPRGGTPLMQDNQVSGIDLPVKALVWQDAEARVWLTYNDARWLAERHGLGEASRPSIDVMAGGLAALARAATQV